VIENYCNTPLGGSYGKENYDALITGPLNKINYSIDLLVYKSENEPGMVISVLSLCGAKNPTQIYYNDALLKIEQEFRSIEVDPLSKTEH
jgi:hypothetical protein